VVSDFRGNVLVGSVSRNGAKTQYFKAFKTNFQKTLLNESKETNTYNIIWNVRDNDNRQVATEIYFYKMQASGFQKTMKIMLMK
jgi:hypothetical protein